MRCISVFTPTYNRLELLKRLYRSLCDQNEMNFEWVVVDDASTDGTEEWIIKIKQESPFQIQYKKITHGGKHRAINCGVELAQGDYIFFVDSDDYLPKEAIETIGKWIKDLTGQERIAGVAGLRMDPSGKIVGEQPDIQSGDYLECSNLQRYRKHLQGDKAEIYRTDVLKQYPFPEYDNEFFLTERIVWDRIAADGYSLRWYNIPIYVCDYQEGGLTKSGANQFEGHVKNQKGYLEYVKQSLRLMEPLEAVTIFREYNKTTKYQGKKLAERWEQVDMNNRQYLIWLIIKTPLLYAVRLGLRAFQTK